MAGGMLSSLGEPGRRKSVATFVSSSCGVRLEAGTGAEGRGPRPQELATERTKVPKGWDGLAEGEHEEIGLMRAMMWVSVSFAAGGSAG